MSSAVPLRKEDELFAVYGREYLGRKLAEGPPRPVAAINQNRVRSPVRGSTR